MAGLRVFVSSTCYDLGAVRAHLRLFLQSLGHDPVMSDYNDVLYDPRIHTHSSCVDEVASCDAVLLLIGSRYGGRSVPEAIAKVDFESIQKKSKSVETLKSKENLSVTQLEILKAIEQGLPVFSFVDARVWHDHALYEKNKDSEVLESIRFPSIEKNDVATFVFEFINFLRHRTHGNSVFPFSKIQDIEDVLRKQWSSLFQRLMNEERIRTAESKRIDLLTEQFEDLKTAILTSIGSSNERDVARGVVRFRRLSEFLRALGLQDHNFVLKESHTWQDLLKEASIVRVFDSNDLPPRARDSLRLTGMRSRVFLIKDDDSFYEVRYPLDFIRQLEMDWQAFIELPSESRTVILDALSEMVSGFRSMRYIPEEFPRYIDEMIMGESSQGRSTED